MNLDHLNQELDEFEDFVANYTRQMNDILTKTEPEVGASKDTSIEIKKLAPTNEHEESVKENSDFFKTHVASAADPDPPTQIFSEKKYDKISKTSLDYSRFDKIMAEELSDNESSEEVSNSQELPISTQSSSKNTTPKNKPYSLKSTAPFFTVSEKILEIAQSYKILGNAAVSVADYPIALNHYTNAIETCLHPKREQIIKHENATSRAKRNNNNSESDDPFAFLEKIKMPDPEPIIPDPTLYANRAHAHRGVRDFAAMLEDCDLALETRKAHINIAINYKVLWRRGFARLMLNQFEKAKEDFEQVLKSPHVTANEKHVLIEVQKIILICDEFFDQEQKDAVFFKDSISNEAANQLGPQAQTNFEDFIERLISNETKTSKNPDVEFEMAVKRLESSETRKIFRVFNGFSKLFGDDEHENQSLIPAKTILRIVPVILKLIRTDKDNARELAKNNRITIIVDFAQKSKNYPEIFSEITKLLSICSGIDACIFSITSSIDAPTIQTWTEFIQTGINAICDHPLNVQNIPSSQAIADFLQFLTICLAHDHKTVFTKWKICPTKIIAALKNAINHCATFSAAISAVTTVTALKGAPKQLVVELCKQRDVFVDSLLANELSEESFACDSVAAMSCLHNIVAISMDPLGSEVATRAVRDVIGKVGGKVHSTLAGSVLAKIQARNPEVAKRCVDDVGGAFWLRNLLVAMKQGEGGIRVGCLSESRRGGGNFDDVANQIQVLAGWLMQVDGKNDAVAKFRQECGFEIICDLIVRAAQIVSDNIGKDELNDISFDRFVGNLSLAVSECLIEAADAEIFSSLGITDPMVKLLRYSASKKLLTKKSSCKNISIACARLAQNEKARNRMRDLKAIELLYGIGAKII
ncbi:hypothetical protein HK100_002660 [Physocladia obscura]|uniref:Uncharacterized protein n=1 Tax=Physocladia obscura TaxID=109957 RepID=A0AAD5SV27_9FUNG|nr:hypothetical protein HK100_002660 [Physocladia obscura]